MKFKLQNPSFFKTGWGLKQAMRILKISLVLVLATCFQVSAKSYAQMVSIKASGVSLEKICMEIHQQTGYNFFYKDDCINTAKKVTVNLQNAPLTDALDACLKGQAISYKITGKTVVLTLKETIADQQPVKYTIKGNVTEKAGSPIYGVAVVIKGTLKGTTTDLNGYYTIDVPEKATLIFSFLGYQKKEINIMGKKVVNVVMEEEAAELAEAVFISTGYQKIKPEQSTGSLATIKAREFNTRVNTTDFLIGLQNKIPGLLINNDIQFEGNSLFQIRGISTIYGNKSPLIVVDGYPTELSIDMINPNEIESVTILKDAAAATVYGARSSNGVIIIERKKAIKGAPVVNFSTTCSFTPKENYDRYRWDKDASNTLVEWEKINSANLSGTSWNRLTTIDGYTDDYNPAILIMSHWRSNTNAITTEERDQQLAELSSYNNTKDYSRLFLRTAVTQTYNMDISGGNEHARYYITSNYINNDLTQIKNNNSTFKISGRTTVDFSKRFSLDLTTDFQRSTKKSVTIPEISNIYPYERFQDKSGTPLSIFYNSRTNPYFNDVIMALGMQDNRYYPLREIDEVSDETHYTNNRITANFRYTLSDELNFTFGGVYESSVTNLKHLASEESAEARQYINQYTGSSSGKLVFNIPQGGFLKQQKSSMDGFTLRAQLNYNKQLLKDHTLNLILGGEIREIVEKSSTAAFFGYNDNTLFSIPVDYKVVESFSGLYLKNNPKLSYSNLFSQKYVNNRYVSAYSNLVYSIKGKYSLTGSIRIDQSNLFGTDPKYKYKPLWSVGAAWNIHKESFMNEVEWINTLKFRTAYGFNGNVAKNSISQVIAANGLNTITPNEITSMLSLYSYANNGLRWEQTRNFNVGVDFNVLKNIKGSVDYYIKESTDILATNQIDATKGGSSALMNIASIRNSGFEIDLHTDWITRNKFNWNMGLVFSYNTSKVKDVYNVSINPSSPSINYLSGSYSDYLEGYAVGAMFALRYAGVDNEGLPLMYDSEGNSKRFFTNSEGLKELDYMGSSIPVYNTGISNRLDIGNFYFYCMVNLYGGFSVRLPVPSPYTGYRPLEGAANYWKQAGDEADPNILPFPRSQYSSYLTYTDRYTVSGAYLTLGDVTASYSLRDLKFVRKSRISNIEIKMQASNLYTIGFNKYNFSKATRSFDKSYLTPTYTLGLYVSF